MRLNVYLFFDGTCAEAFERYQAIFGGEFMARLTYGDGPDTLHVDPAHTHRIMHVSLPIGNATLMGSDIAGTEAHRPGSNFAVSVHPETRDEGDRVFQALAEGGEVTFPMQETFWGSYFGTCRDRFGIHWQVNVPQ